MCSRKATETDRRQNEKKAYLRTSDWVEVRSEKEILATLGERGACEGLPFMPEMLRYCGQRFEVLKRADKTCDSSTRTVRRLHHTVHLRDLRCDGSAHGKCEAGCLMFWKEQWLKPVDGSNLLASGTTRRDSGRSRVSAQELIQFSRRAMTTSDGEVEEIFSCQATGIARFTSVLPWWKLAQYLRDLVSGNVRAKELARGLLFGALAKARSLAGNNGYRSLNGKNVRTPSVDLELKPGDIVRVKSASEIAETLDRHGKNRGLAFAAGMRKYCGGEYRVLRRVVRIIDESTGKMILFKNNCYVLEGVVCPMETNRFCPRMVYEYWRDIWLRKVDDSPLDRSIR